MATTAQREDRNEVRTSSQRILYKYILYKKYTDLIKCDTSNYLSTNLWWVLCRKKYTYSDDKHCFLIEYL